MNGSDFSNGFRKACGFNGGRMDGNLLGLWNCFCERTENDELAMDGDCVGRRTSECLDDDDLDELARWILSGDFIMSDVGFGHLRSFVASRWQGDRPLAYDIDGDQFLSEPELKEEYGRLVSSGDTEAPSFDDYLDGITGDDGSCVRI